MATTAVVILNYNGKDYLEKFLPTVINHSTEAEIIVADNASTDDSISFLQSHFPQIKLITLDKNHGYAGGYNEALKQVHADYFLLLNSDVEVTENWLPPLIQFLEENDDYAACQPKIKDYNHKSLFEYAGACGGFIDLLGYPYCRGRIFNHLEADSGQYNEQIDIFWSSGACMLIRSKTFIETGGFDRDFFAHMEEIDLCWRIHSLDFKIKSIPSSTVYHVGGGTLAKGSPFKTYLNFRNGLYLLIKNLPLAKLILSLPPRIVLDWVAAFKFMIGGELAHSLAIFKAHIAVLFNLIKTIRKRTVTSSPSVLKLIVFDYFFRGKRKFDQL
ncbi:hypothetical protein SAMN05421640_3253 [Ekhidna lutea]|uniref:Glycosyltransferase 2-like domain-containing protein n=1 Tax=Ekhidna lutea TaxID=447679 RepID=A0A239LFR7_EKHLU|nr:glycosyltransferase family 2 protein [Ekhidna lutea]SNT29497.1 hypothetical protein SAMN05421640_3253 [Ekhidna lutea]